MLKSILRSSALLRRPGNSAYALIIILISINNISAFKLGYMQLSVSEWTSSEASLPDENYRKLPALNMYFSHNKFSSYLGLSLLQSVAGNQSEFVFSDIETYIGYTLMGDYSNRYDKFMLTLRAGGIFPPYIPTIPEKEPFIGAGNITAYTGLNLMLPQKYLPKNMDIMLDAQYKWATGLTFTEKQLLSESYLPFSELGSYQTFSLIKASYSFSKIKPSIESFLITSNSHWKHGASEFKESEMTWAAGGGLEWFVLPRLALGLNGGTTILSENTNKLFGIITSKSAVYYSANIGISL